MQRIVYPIVISLILLCAHCKKDVETDAELISKKLQQVIDEEEVIRVIPTTDHVTAGIPIYGAEYGKQYKFNPPFILIGSTQYNLASLKQYYLSYVDSDKTLFLVF